jgi:hypothetical protein
MAAPSSRGRRRGRPSASTAAHETTPAPTTPLPAAVGHAPPTPIPLLMPGVGDRTTPPPAGQGHKKKKKKKKKTLP